MRLQTMHLFYRVISIHLVDTELKCRKTEVTKKTHTNTHTYTQRCMKSLAPHYPLPVTLTRGISA